MPNRDNSRVMGVSWEGVYLVFASKGVGYTHIHGIKFSKHLHVLQEQWWAEILHPCVPQRGWE